MSEHLEKAFETLMDKGGAKALTDLAVFYLEGDDALSWLQGQVTQDLRGLGEDEARYALILQRNGRVLTDLWASHTQKGVRIVIPKTQAEALRHRVEEHVIMEDVELEDSQEQVFTLLGALRTPDNQSTSSVATCKTNRLGIGGYDCFVSPESSEDFRRTLEEHCKHEKAVWLNDSLWAWSHLKRRRARFGIEFDGRHLPQEAGLAKDAVSFDKGCYLGQEAVVMLEHRGKLSRRLAALRGPASYRGEAQQSLQYEDQDVGSVAATLKSDSDNVTRMSAWLQVKRLGGALESSESMKLLTADGSEWSFEGFYGDST